MLIRDVTIKDWKQWHADTNKFLSERRVVDALDKLSSMAKKTEVSMFIDEIQNSRETYKNILYYSFSDVEDPSREDIYKHLIHSLFELSDDLKFHHVAFASQKNEEEKKRNRYLFLNYHKEENKELSYDNVSENIFYDIVSLGKLQEEDKQFLQKILLTDKLPWYEKSIFLSALMLSLQQCFDKQKFLLLFSVFDKKEEQLWQRALVVLMIAYYQYNDRMAYYPDLLKVWEDYAGNPDFEKQIELIVIQFLRARDTEKINKKLNEDLLPEVQKITPKIMDKLGLDDILSEEDEEGENPEWKTVFEDTPGLYDKLEEISKLQMEGSDVFMGAFSQLKSFPFFNTIVNWFLPFHEKSPQAREMLKNETFDVNEFVESLSKSPFLCNSDKYSFCLNMALIPASQKKMMTSMMFEELKMMGEIGKEDELVNKTARNKTVFMQCIQDLYRFHKLYRDKDMFYNIFDQQYDFYETLFFKKNVVNKTTVRNIGEFCLEKQHYAQAISVFQRLLLEPDYDSSELLEKIAYSYQKLKNYKQAIAYYHKAELLDTNLMWLYKNLIFCYRKTGDPEKIIAYAEKAINMEREDTYLLTYMGHAFFDLEDYEKAMQYYFKVEYLSSNTKIYRPIAWCAFVLGKFDVAEKYYRLILELKNPGYFDYMNFAHVSWCVKKYEQAKSLYVKAVNLGGISIRQFQKEMLNDKKYLLMFGIEEYDVHLMLDYVKINATA